MANTILGEGGRDGKYYPRGRREGKNYRLRYLDLFYVQGELKFFLSVKVLSRFIFCRAVLRAAKVKKNEDDARNLKFWCFWLYF